MCLRTNLFSRYLSAPLPLYPHAHTLTPTYPHTDIFLFPHTFSFSHSSPNLFTASSSSRSMVFGLGFLSLGQLSTDQIAVQRYLTASSVSACRRSVYLNGLIQVSGAGGPCCNNPLTFSTHPFSFSFPLFHTHTHTHTHSLSLSLSLLL